MGRGTKQNASSAIEWYKKAADNGSADACIKLGNIYMYGTYDTTLNETLAEQYFNKALTIDNNNTIAKIKLTNLNTRRQQQEQIIGKEDILLALKCFGGVVGFAILLILLLRGCF